MRRVPVITVEHGESRDERDEATSGEEKPRLTRTYIAVPTGAYEIPEAAGTADGRNH